jgi:hypothetical protein
MNIHRHYIAPEAFNGVLNFMSLREKINLGMVSREWYLFLAKPVERGVYEALVARIPEILTFGDGDPDDKQYRYDFHSVQMSRGRVLQWMDILTEIKKRRKGQRFPRKIRLLFDECIFNVPKESHAYIHYDVIGTINFMLMVQHKVLMAEHDSADNIGIVILIVFNMLLMYLLLSKKHHRGMFDDATSRAILAEKLEEARKLMNEMRNMPNIVRYHMIKNIDRIRASMLS